MKIAGLTVLLLVVATSSSPTFHKYRGIFPGWKVIKGHNRVVGFPYPCVKGYGVFGHLIPLCRGVRGERASNAVDILRAVAGYRLPGTFDGSINVIIELGRACGIFVDVIIPGLGQLLSNLVIGLSRILVCALGSPSFFGVKFGDRRPGFGSATDNYLICQPNYGSKWGWRLFQKGYKNPSLILDSYGIRHAGLKADQLIKKATRGRGVDSLPYAHKLIVLMIRGMCDLADRDIRYYSKNDLLKLHITISSIIGAFGRSCQRGLGVRIASGINVYIKTNFENYGITGVAEALATINANIAKFDQNSFSDVIIPFDGDFVDDDSQDDKSDAVVAKDDDDSDDTAVTVATPTYDGSLKGIAKLLVRILNFKINVVNDVFGFVFRLCFGISGLIDATISGLGSLLSRIIAVIFKIGICFKGFPGDRSICNKGWNKQFYIDGEASNANDLIDLFKLGNVQSDVDGYIKSYTRGKGIKAASGSVRILLERCNILSGFVKNHQQITKDTIATTFVAVTTITAAFANANKRDSGKQITRLIPVCGRKIKELGYPDITNQVNDVEVIISNANDDKTVDWTKDAGTNKDLDNGDNNSGDTGNNNSGDTGNNNDNNNSGNTGNNNDNNNSGNTGNNNDNNNSGNTGNNNNSNNNSGNTGNNNDNNNNSGNNNSGDNNDNNGKDTGNDTNNGKDKDTGKDTGKGKDTGNDKDNGKGKDTGKGKDSGKDTGKDTGKDKNTGDNKDTGKDNNGNNGNNSGENNDNNNGNAGNNSGDNSGGNTGDNNGSNGDNTGNTDNSGSGQGSGGTDVSGSGAVDIGGLLNNALKGLAGVNKLSSNGLSEIINIKLSSVDDVLNLCAKLSLGVGGVIESVFVGLGSLFSRMVAVILKIAICVNKLPGDRGICNKAFNAKLGINGEANTAKDLAALFRVRKCKSDVESMINTYSGGKGISATPIPIIFQTVLGLADIVNSLTATKEDVLTCFTSIFTIYGVITNSYQSNLGSGTIQKIFPVCGRFFVKQGYPDITPRQKTIITTISGANNNGKVDWKSGVKLNTGGTTDVAKGDGLVTGVKDLFKGIKKDNNVNQTTVTAVLNIEIPRNLEDVLAFSIKIIQALGSIIDLFISGLGSLLVRIFGCILRYVVCVVGAAKNSNSFVCQKAYFDGFGISASGDGWDDLVSSFKVTSAKNDLDVILNSYTNNKGRDVLTGSLKICFDQIYGLLPILGKGKSMSDADLSSVLSIATTLLGGFANSWSKDLGNQICGNMIPVTNSCLSKNNYPALTAQETIELNIQAANGVEAPWTKGTQTTVVNN